MLEGVERWVRGPPPAPLFADASWARELRSRRSGPADWDQSDKSREQIVPFGKNIRGSLAQFTSSLVGSRNAICVDGSSNRKVIWALLPQSMQQ